MNDKSTGMIGKVVQWAVALLGIIFVIMIFMGKDSGIDGGLYVTYIAFALCAGIAIIFGLLALIGNKKALISIALFAAMVVVAYLLAGDEVKPGTDITANVSKWIGAGIGVVAVLALGAIGAIVIGEARRMLK